jgi:hypothetical protein
MHSSSLENLSGQRMIPLAWPAFSFKSNLVSRSGGMRLSMER